MFPFKRKEEIQNLFLKNDLFVLSTVILSQSVKHSPFRIIVKGSTKKITPEKPDSIAIWNEHQQYSHQFIDLLNDYYLHL